MKTDLVEETNPYLSLYREAEARLARGLPSWFGPRREAALARFREVGFPGPREEAWRFTNLKGLKKLRPALPEGPVDGDPVARAAAAASLAGSAASQLVFVNGRHAPHLSSVSEESGILLGNLPREARDHESRIRPHLGEIADLERHPFAAMNTAFLADGAFLVLPRDTVLREPVHLLFVTLGGPWFTHPRVLVLAEAGSEARIVEEYVGVGETPYFANALTEIALAENASVDHTRLQREGDGGYHIGAAAVRVGAHGRYTSHVVSVGARLARLDIDVDLQGEGAECSLNGLYLGSGRQHLDHHTRVDHRSPHTVSRELYKGVLDGKATAVFNGRVIIRPGAQKIDASQTNNNLLLSTEAQVNTNPELEIFADDVKAQHGATVGQIDEDQLFYLRSRGISRSQARRLLIRAFAGEMLDRLAVDPLREVLQALFDRRF